MKFLFVLLFFISILASTLYAGKVNEAKTKSLAILPFKSHSQNLNTMAAAIPEMLISEMVGIKEIQFVERSRIEQAKKAIDEESSKVQKANTELEIGKWLGANFIAMGSLNELDHQVRIDMRIIDIHSGTIQFATHVSGQRNQLLNLISELGIKARKSLLNGPEIHSISELPANSAFNKSLETVKVLFSLNLKLGVFTTRSFPIQKVRLYVDGKLQAESDPINQFNRKWDLFEVDIPVGYHKVEVVHGMINRKGEWRSSLKHQPASFSQKFATGSEKRILYSQTVYNDRVSYSEIN